MTTLERARYPDYVEVRPDFPGPELDKIWETEPGLLGWLASVDHKQIGLRYIVTALAFLLLGGVEALVMRLQLARPNQHLLSSEQYNQLFTMHGVTMIFLYAAPILSGFSNYLWPLLLGSRDMAFPRLNALSYWIYLAAGLFMYGGFVTGRGPDDGWFNYVPYAGRAFNPGVNIDIYALGLILLGISTTVGSANFVVTFLRTRAPGMSINRVPILIWGTLTASVANLLAVPSVSLAFFLLWMDRQFGTRFFDTGEGQPLLWQHLFWMFGHPWVYAIVLPAMGMVSDGLPTFCRRPLVGYTGVALATVATMALGFGVWVHHMFATGLPNLALSFFSAASIVIVIPSAVAVFAWTATIWVGRPVVTTAFLYFAGMIVLFVIGGVSGFMTGSVPLDWQLTDTYFIVAHLHYVLIGINVFPVAGAVYYWFPKFTGRLLDERLGRWNFWTMFVGFNLTFFPMHILGLLGMPRRVYTYPEGLGWELNNLIISMGAFLFAGGVLLLIINIAGSLKAGAPAGENPWGAPTLEWSVPSPPPPYNFAVIPHVASRHPLWEDQLDESRERSQLTHGLLLHRGRETIATTPLDGEPNLILEMPGDTRAPLALAVGLALAFAGALPHAWWVVALGLAISVAALLSWLWPRSGHANEPRAADNVDHAATEGPPLPVGSRGKNSVGWWGALCLIATEAVLFAYLVFSYFYVAVQRGPAWSPEPEPTLKLAGPNTVLLLASSIAVWWGEKGAKNGRRGQQLTGLGIGILMGIGFLIIQVFEWKAKSFGLDSGSYGSLYFVITGLHMAHVVVGLAMLLAVFGWSLAGYFPRQRHAPISISSIYWHFVDVVWLCVFFTFYINPYLMW